MECVIETGGKHVPIHVYHSSRLHKKAVTNCRLSSDGRFAISGSTDCTASVWDLRTGHVRCVLQGHSAKVNGCVLTAGARFAVTTSSDGWVRGWSARTGKMLWKKRQPNAYHAFGCAISGDEKYVYCVHQGIDDASNLLGRFVSYRTETGVARLVLRLPDKLPYQCDVSKPGSIAAISYANKHENCRVLFQDIAYERTIRNIACSSKGQPAAVSLDAFGKIALVVDAESVRICHVRGSIDTDRKLRLPGVGPHTVPYCDLSQDGTLGALNTGSNRHILIHLTGADESKVLHRPIIYDTNASGIALSKYGGRAAVGDAKGVVRGINLNTRPVARHRGLDPRTQSKADAASSILVVTGEKDILRCLSSSTQNAYTIRLSDLTEDAQRAIRAALLR